MQSAVRAPHTCCAVLYTLQILIIVCGYTHQCIMKTHQCDAECFPDRVGSPSNQCAVSKARINTCVDMAEARHIYPSLGIQHIDAVPFDFPSGR